MPIQKPLPVFSIEDITPPFKKQAFSFLVHNEKQWPGLAYPHKHDFFMLLFFTKARGTHSIDFKEYATHKYQVHFLAPGQAHHWKFQSGTSGIQLMFGPDFLPDTRQWPFFSWSGNPVLDLSTAKFNELLAELSLMEKEYRNADHFSIEILAHRLLVLLNMLQRFYESAHPDLNPTPVKKIMMQFTDLVETHYREEPTVEYYAAVLHVTPQHLNNTCKRESGITAGAFIRQRILLEARRLLSFSGMDVKEIAYHLGFSDTSYFSRFVRRYTGLTPLAFRQQVQKVPGSSR
ncbi:AraC family transcriptional regulator [Pseudobacter ginsenosidimutans]|uniref:AraC-like DNA-binding protein n=1 Tax=Pseudobacter ginsenosidimutans TaxID=661488 RepID=A0A4Q7N5D3_9BACT|nr:AraC family transcriptional regulator [Pseudobacter ginsenosidimutans]QEC44753.1 helix-turn-helix transcriptional regulator [Pseudobacter ginsenosidimutans]RZS76238.1 AraC-like DNA-binding protein [Pseudobacter ginsenosidimutans]